MLWTWWRLIIVLLCELPPTSLWLLYSSRKLLSPVFRSTIIKAVLKLCFCILQPMWPLHQRCWCAILARYWCLPWTPSCNISLTKRISYIQQFLPFFHGLGGGGAKTRHTVMYQWRVAFYWISTQYQVVLGVSITKVFTEMSRVVVRGELTLTRHWPESDRLNDFLTTVRTYRNIHVLCVSRLDLRSSKFKKKKQKKRYI